MNYGFRKRDIRASSLNGAFARVLGDRRPAHELPPLALLYLLVVAAATAAAALPPLAGLEPTSRQWLTFAVLGASVALAQLFVVRIPGNRSYHTTGVFLIPAALLLPVELVALIAVVQHVPDWLRNRTAWYIQSFNIFNYTLSTLGAWVGAQTLLGADGLIANDELRFALAGLAACLCFVGLNSALIAPMLHLGRGQSMRLLFSLQHFSTELVFAALGVVLAAFWSANPWLVPFAIAPLLLIHRALSVPQLQAEARVDPKTGLFNARHFTAALDEEMGRAQRFGRPLSVIMADLDLLRELNNTYGHLAGDAVLKGIAEVFRAELRHYDVPARFGGEEFSILLPETSREEALEIAERIRREVAARRFDVETSNEPMRVTVSIGVASFPVDAADPTGLVHQADLAVYRAKLQGRNRVCGSSSEPLHVPFERTERLAVVPAEAEGPLRVPLERARVEPVAEPEPGRADRSRTRAGFRELPLRLALGVSLVSALGLAAGVGGLLLGNSLDVAGMLAIVALVGIGQALSLALDDGAISVGAIGALAGSAIFGSRVALALALAIAIVDWSARRPAVHNVLFNVGALSLACLAAATVSSADPGGGIGDLVTIALGVLAGAAYFAVNTGLHAFAIVLESREPWWRGWWERCLWLAPHYLVYGSIGGVITIGYDAVGLYSLVVFVVPLLLMRKTQEAHLSDTRRSTQKLRQAAETIHTQNVSLEQANRLLKERSTAAMVNVSATVDARDATGHSHRVQQLALAMGRELSLSQAELDLLGHAALFHDIGKLAVPDAVLLKPASLTDEEWTLMQRHADEGARIIDRLGFLTDAVPAIRHHHERFDGTGYPGRLTGEEIPLGARIIHVADALDSMLTARIYRAARPLEEALDEVRRTAGTQFCPRCVAALERVLPEHVRADAGVSPPAQAVRRVVSLG